jgi:hypothetical protein
MLVHCFGGCAVHEVLTAVGLTVGDLYQRRDLRSLSPAERREYRQHALLPKWRAALESLSFEATVVMIAAAKLSDGEPLEPHEQVRMGKSALAIFDASEVLNAR